MAAVISVDAYPFLTFSDLNCHLEDTGVDVSYFRGPWVSFVTTDGFSVRVKKLFQGLVSYELTAWLFLFDLFLTQ